MRGGVEVIVEKKEERRGRVDSRRSSRERSSSVTEGRRERGTDKGREELSLMRVNQMSGGREGRKDTYTRRYP
jgi:hypothetical protein